MARLEIYNSLGQVDLSVVDPAAVAEMSDAAQQAFSIFIAKVAAREAASARYVLAVKALNDAGAEQHAALAEHAAINLPQTVQQQHAEAVAAYNKSL
jgi:hypothetical protein